MEHLLLDVDAGTALITLNRPERYNAYTRAMGAELFRTLGELDADDAVRAIVITGAGKHFCAGAELDASGDTFKSSFRSTREAEAAAQPYRMQTPVIAALNGAAVGIGATLPLQWDIRIASERARIGFVFVRRGIIPEASSTWLLPRLVGMSVAADLLLTGRMIEADEALRVGLVSRVVAHDDLLDSALDMARDIARNTAPVSVAITKRLLWRQLAELDPRAAKAREDELFEWSGKQPDAVEGVKSFMEKRAPAWSLSANRDTPTIS